MITYHSNNIAAFAGNHRIYSTLQSFMHPLQRIAKASPVAWYKIALEEHDASFLHVTSNQTDVVSYAFMMGC